MECPLRAVLAEVIGVLAEDQPQTPFAADRHPVQTRQRLWGSEIRFGWLTSVFRSSVGRRSCGVVLVGELAGERVPGPGDHSGPGGPSH
jgi:hypothetical protein